jgi:hypothetical protein
VREVRRRQVGWTRNGNRVAAGSESPPPAPDPSLARLCDSELEWPQQLWLIRFTEVKLTCGRDHESSSLASNAPGPGPRPVRDSLIGPGRSASLVSESDSSTAHRDRGQPWARPRRSTDCGMQVTVVAAGPGLGPARARAGPATITESGGTVTVTAGGGGRGREAVGSRGSHVTRSGRNRAGGRTSSPSCRSAAASHSDGAKRPGGRRQTP